MQGTKEMSLWTKLMRRKYLYFVTTKLTLVLCMQFYVCVHICAPEALCCLVVVEQSLGLIEQTSDCD